MLPEVDLKAFECCLEEGLRPLDFKLVDHIYEATKHCAVHINQTIGLNRPEFLSRVFKFYLYDMKNITTSQCSDKVYNYEWLCDEPTKTGFLVYFVFWIFALLLGLMANLLVIVAFLQSKKLRKNIANYFTVSLASSDLLVILFLIPYKAYYALHNHNFCLPGAACNLYFIADVIFFVASITNLFAIAIDRFLALSKPYQYRKIVSKCRARGAIAVIWIYSFFWGGFTNFNFRTMKFDAVKYDNNHCSIMKDIDTLVEYFIVFFLPCIIMLFFYIKIYKITLIHVKNIESIRRSLKDNNGHRRSSGFIRAIIESSFFVNKRIELKATRVVFVVYGTFLFCWLPAIIIVSVKVLNVNLTVSKTIYFIFGEILPLVNSILNPFIYGIMHRDFKSSLKRIFKKIYGDKSDFRISYLKDTRSLMSIKKYDTFDSRNEEDQIKNNKIIENSKEEIEVDDSHETVCCSTINREEFNSSSEETPTHKRLEQIIYTPAGQQSLNHELYIPHDQLFESMISSPSSNSLPMNNTLLNKIETINENVSEEFP